MACATVRRGGRVTHSGDYCTTTTGTGVRWRAAQSFVLLDERHNLAASDPIYLTRASKDKNNCNVRENSDRRQLRECSKKTNGGGCTGARQQRWLRESNDLQCGQDDGDRFLKKAIKSRSANARQQRSAMNAKTRNNGEHYAQKKGGGSLHSSCAASSAARERPFTAISSACASG